MKECTFRFYEELNDFLPRRRRKTEFVHSFRNKPSVKEAIEALRVPHAEVDLVLVNGRPVDYSYKLRGGERIAVYPVFESLDISPLNHLHEKPLRDTKFILDAHLGRLARYLRICGFDSLYDNYYKDPEVIDIAHHEHRIILTRDRELLKNNRVTHGYWMRSEEPRLQLKEVIDRFDLGKKLKLFSRCTVCNTVLKEINKDKVAARLQPGTRKNFDEFWICPGCDRIYWNGSHYERMKQFVEGIAGHNLHLL